MQGDTEIIAVARPDGIPPIIWKFLESRGLHSEKEREKLLKSSLKDMRDPSCLAGVDKACERFEKALRDQECVCVYGDFDLDGSSGLALAVDALKRMGFKKVKHYQPKRLSEGYGVHPEAIEKLFNQEDVTLLFTVDVGITAVDAVEKANSLGMDVIISDHHLAKETLPNAYSIINPNMEECNSGLGHLCGAGVAFYTMLALRRHLKSAGLLEKDFNPKDLLDLFIIGTLTDMVPLHDENRTLTKHGLEELKNTKRPGLKVLLEELGYTGKVLSGQDVAIGIAPKLNALSRLEMGIMPVDVLMAETTERAQELVSRVLELNSLRKKLQEEAEKDADKKYNENKTSNYVFVWSESYHKGVVGLVATKLCQNYGVPAFVASCDVDAKLVGSARCPDGTDISLPEAMEYGSEFLEGFGGHAQAAGFHLKKENIEAFNLKLSEYFESKDLSQSKAQLNSIDFDIEAGFSDVDTQFMKWMEVLGPFGQEFPVPALMFKNVQITNCRELRGGHLKWKLLDPNRKAYSFDALLFSPSKEMKVWKEGDFVSVVAQVQWNYFAGRKSIQLLVQSVSHGESP